MTRTLFRNFDLVATMDTERREIRGGSVLVDGNVIRAVSDGALALDADRVIDGRGKILLPGFVNTHHHLYQTRTRAWPGAVNAELFDWLRTLYPVWAELRDVDFHEAALVGCRELLRSGCTTTTDHQYLFPRDASPKLIDITIEAAREAGCAQVAVVNGGFKAHRREADVAFESLGELTEHLRSII